MKRKVILIPIILCMVGVVGCTSKSKMDIKSIKMETNTKTEPFTDLKSQWNDMNIEKYIVRTAQQIFDTWEFTNKIWPGTDYSQYNVIFAETNGENAWIISQKDKSITKFNKKELPKEYTVKGAPNRFISSESMLNGIPTIMVEVDSEMFKTQYTNGEFESLPTSTSLFPFTTHEEFHKYQNAWKVGQTNQEKLFKIGEYNFDARAKRLEIVNALNKAVLEPEKEMEYLDAAKWWLEKYKQDHKEEYDLVKPLDVLEGCGRYFDMAMNIRSIGGMDMDKEEVLKMYQKLISQDYKLEVDRFYGLPDEESYDIGGPAGILLEMKNDTQWKLEAEKGIPPIEILLKDCKGTPQKPSQEVEKLIKDIKDKKNSQK